MKEVSSQALPNGHAEINEQSDPRDSHTGIGFVGGCEVGIVMIVRMTGVCPGLCLRGCGDGHDGCN